MRIVCAICTDLITATDEVYSTPCGHIFHHLCLCNWMESSNTCPQCRQVTDRELNHRVFLNFSNNGTETSTEKIAILDLELDNLIRVVNEAKLQLTNIKEDFATKEQQNDSLKFEKAELVRRENFANLEIVALKEQIKSYETKLNKYNHINNELPELRRKLKEYENMKTFLEQTREQVDKLLRKENNLDRRLKEQQNELISLKYELDTAHTVNENLQQLIEEQQRLFEHAKASWDEEKAEMKSKEQKLITGHSVNEKQDSNNKKTPDNNSKEAEINES